MNPAVRVAVGTGFVLAVCLSGGCGPSPSGQTSRPSPAPPVAPVVAFVPVRIVIAPWTEIISPADKGGSRQIRALVRLTDAFGSDMKAPGTFRFELYERLSRSVEARGKRLVLWPDFDMTSAEQNNAHWRDFLRAYEFTLDVAVTNGGTCILEATFIPPEGRRLTAQYVLTGPK